MNNMLLYMALAGACVGLTLPAHGHGGTARSAQEPDTAVVTDEEWIMSDSAAYEDWDEASQDEELAADDSTYEPEEICPTDYELLADFNAKEADYKYQNKANANTGIEFSARIFTPGEVKKQSGFNRMASAILCSTLPEGSQSSWKIENLDKMLENKWKIVKEAYIADMNAFGDKAAAPESPDVAPFFPTYSYRTNVMPAWRFEVAGGVITYKVDDEVFRGGAHGMPYSYYLSLCEATDSLMGLTDIFKAESLSAVFQLVSQKLASRPNAPQEDEAWKPIAELSEAPQADNTLLRAHALEPYQGKWYPRPAITSCGILFSYAPYEKGCYAEGTVNILLPFEEIAQYLKIKL